MFSNKTNRMSWKDLLAKGELVLLPSAHDGLTAKLIEQAGFSAFQVGGFSVVGARFGAPDIDLYQFGELSQTVKEVLDASSLPAMVDADNCYGDVKNVVHVVRTYELIGASAIFIEDQQAPKRCGHMAGKQVIPAELATQKIAAAAASRETDLFLVARTDARAPLGLDEALRRGEAYLKAGADGLFVEAPQSAEEVERVAEAFRGTPLVLNMLEGGGKTPLLAMPEIKRMGFSMVFYPTSLIFTVTKALQAALKIIKDGGYPAAEMGVDFDRYEEAVGLPEWKAVEDRFQQLASRVEAVPRSELDTGEAGDHPH